MKGEAIDLFTSHQFFSVEVREDTSQTLTLWGQLDGAFISSRLFSLNSWKGVLETLVLHSVLCPFGPSLLHTTLFPCSLTCSKVIWNFKTFLVQRRIRKTQFNKLSWNKQIFPLLHSTYFSSIPSPPLFSKLPKNSPLSSEQQMAFLAPSSKYFHCPSKRQHGQFHCSKTLLCNFCPSLLLVVINTWPIPIWRRNFSLHVTLHCVVKSG